MSAVEADPVSVKDYTHPEWCDLTKCEPGRSHSRPHGVHHSAGTRWGLQSDEVDFAIELVRSDDYLGEQNHATTRLRLEMQAAVGEGDDPGAGFFADAWVDASDARMLAAMLTRYAERADRDNRIGRRDLDLQAHEVPRLRMP